MAQKPRDYKAPMKHNLKVTKRVLDKVYKLSKIGATKEAIGSALGLSRATFYRMCESNDALATALREGREKDLGEIDTVLREKALEGSYQHMAGYYRRRHGIEIGDNNGAAGGGTQVTINLPFGANIDAITQSKTIDNEAHHTSDMVGTKENLLKSTT